MEVLSKLMQSGIEDWMKADSPQESFRAYNELIWRIITAPKEDLGIIVRQIWDKYYDLPTPIAVLICRLCAQEHFNDEMLLSECVSFIRGHCSPGEEQGALNGIYERIKSAGLNPDDFAFGGWTES